MSETNQTRMKISSFFMFLIFVMFILSVAALYQVIESFRKGTLDVTSILISLGAFIISLYMLLQVKMKPRKSGIEMREVLTTIECVKCGYTNIRNFQNGDFIFKTFESCPKCKEQMFVSNIYSKDEKKQ